MLVIVDYGAGNLLSIKNMLRKIGYNSITISSDCNVISQADKLILPGVGHFDFGMQQLHKSGLVNVLNEKVLKNKIPILGICLGAQLLTRGSEEGSEKGLEWIDADTINFNKENLSSGMKIPHMGWNDVYFNNETALFDDMYSAPRFYFVHSFHMVCDHEKDIAITAKYGYEFTAGIEKDNIIGVQFHPEKSHKYGMKLLENFITKY